jgi:hypothetical protein
MNLPVACYISLVTTGLAACATESWPVPEGTADDIATACRAEAASRIEEFENAMQQQREDMAGASDDIMHDAKVAEQTAESGMPPADVLFYLCLEANGVELDPDQIKIIDDWRER